MEAAEYKRYVYTGNVIKFPHNGHVVIARNVHFETYAKTPAKAASNIKCRMRQSYNLAYSVPLELDGTLAVG